MLGRVFIALLSPLASLYEILSNNLLLEWMPLVQPFTVAWRMNFMSLVFGVASASLFFTVLYRLTDRHLPTALFFSACFAFRFCSFLQYFLESFFNNSSKVP